MDWLKRRYTQPVVAVEGSAAAEAACRVNGLTVVQLLRPFAAHRGTLYARTSDRGETIACSGFAVRLVHTSCVRAVSHRARARFLRHRLHDVAASDLAYGEQLDHVLGELLYERSNSNNHSSSSHCERDKDGSCSDQHHDNSSITCRHGGAADGNDDDKEGGVRPRPVRLSSSAATARLLQRSAPQWHASAVRDAHFLVRCGAHDTLDHPVGVLHVLCTRDFCNVVTAPTNNNDNGSGGALALASEGEVVARLQQLQQHLQRVLEQRVWRGAPGMDTDVHRFVLLLHDERSVTAASPTRARPATSGSNDAVGRAAMLTPLPYGEAQRLLVLLQRQLGPNNCALVRVNSNSNNNSNGSRAHDMRSLDPTPWIDANELLCLDVPADTLDATLSAGGSSDDAGGGSTTTVRATFAPSPSSSSSPTRTDAAAAVTGGRLASGDVAELSHAMSNYLSLSLFRHLERRLRALDVVVQERRTTTLGKMAAWFRGRDEVAASRSAAAAAAVDVAQVRNNNNSSNNNNNNNNSNVQYVYTSTSLEMHMRRAADVCMALQDYAAAVSYYKLCIDELLETLSQRPYNRLWLAGCQEGIAIANTFLGKVLLPSTTPWLTLPTRGDGKSKSYVSRLETAHADYRDAGDDAYALRCSLLMYELSRTCVPPALDRARAALLHILRSGEADAQPLYHAMVLDLLAAACLFANPPRAAGTVTPPVVPDAYAVQAYVRSFVVHLMQAGALYEREGATTAALRCYLRVRRVLRVVCTRERRQRYYSNNNNNVGSSASCVTGASWQYMYEHTLLALARIYAHLGRDVDGVVLECAAVAYGTPSYGDARRRDVAATFRAFWSRYRRALASIGYAVSPHMPAPHVVRASFVVHSSSSSNVSSIDDDAMRGTIRSRHGDDVGTHAATTTAATTGVEDATVWHAVEARLRREYAHVASRIDNNDTTRAATPTRYRFPHTRDGDDAPVRLFVATDAAATMASTATAAAAAAARHRALRSHSAHDKTAAVAGVHNSSNSNSPHHRHTTLQQAQQQQVTRRRVVAVPRGEPLLLSLTLHNPVAAELRVEALCLLYMTVATSNNNSNNASTSTPSSPHDTRRGATDANTDTLWRSAAAQDVVLPPRASVRVTLPFMPADEGAYVLVGLAWTLLAQQGYYYFTTLPRARAAAAATAMLRRRRRSPRAHNNDNNDDARNASGSDGAACSCCGGVDKCSHYSYNNDSNSVIDDDDDDDDVHAYAIAHPQPVRDDDDANVYVTVTPRRACVRAYFVPELPTCVYDGECVHTRLCIRNDSAFCTARRVVLQRDDDDDDDSNGDDSGSGSAAAERRGNGRLLALWFDDDNDSSDSSSSGDVTTSSSSTRLLADALAPQQSVCVAVTLRAHYDGGSGDVAQTCYNDVRLLLAYIADDGDGSNNNNNNNNNNDDNNDNATTTTSAHADKTASAHTRHRAAREVAVRLHRVQRRVAVQPLLTLHACVLPPQHHASLAIAVVCSVKHVATATDAASAHARRRDAMVCVARVTAVHDAQWRVRHATTTTRTTTTTTTATPPPPLLDDKANDTDGGACAHHALAPGEALTLPLLVTPVVYAHGGDGGMRAHDTSTPAHARLVDTDCLATTTMTTTHNAHDRDVALASSAKQLYLLRHSVHAASGARQHAATPLPSVTSHSAWSSSTTTTTTMTSAHARDDVAGASGSRRSMTTAVASSSSSSSPAGSPRARRAGELSFYLDHAAQQHAQQHARAQQRATAAADALVRACGGRPAQYTPLVLAVTWAMHASSNDNNNDNNNSHDEDVDAAAVRYGRVYCFVDPLMFLYRTATTATAAEGGAATALGCHNNNNNDVSADVCSSSRAVQRGLCDALLRHACTYMSLLHSRVRYLHNDDGSGSAVATVVIDNNNSSSTHDAMACVYGGCVVYHVSAPATTRMHDDAVRVRVCCRSFAPVPLLVDVRAGDVAAVRRAHGGVVDVLFCGATRRSFVLQPRATHAVAFTAVLLTCGVVDCNVFAVDVTPLRFCAVATSSSFVTAAAMSRTEYVQAVRAATTAATLALRQRQQQQRDDDAMQTSSDDVAYVNEQQSLMTQHVHGSALATPVRVIGGDVQALTRVRLAHTRRHNDNNGDNDDSDASDDTTSKRDANEAAWRQFAAHMAVFAEVCDAAAAAAVTAAASTTSAAAAAGGAVMTPTTAASVAAAAEVYGASDGTTTVQYAYRPLVKPLPRSRARAHGHTHYKDSSNADASDDNNNNDDDDDDSSSSTTSERSALLQHLPPLTLTDVASVDELQTPTLQLPANTQSSSDNNNNVDNNNNNGSSDEQDTTPTRQAALLVDDVVAVDADSEGDTTAAAAAAATRTPTTTATATLALLRDVYNSPDDAATRKQ